VSVGDVLELDEARPATGGTVVLAKGGPLVVEPIKTDPVTSPGLLTGIVPCATPFVPFVLLLPEPVPFEPFAVPFVVELLPVVTVPFALAAL